jgi:predicted transcriptional regulator
MKQQHRHQHLRPHRQHRSNLEIIANILKLALTGASLAYEQLSYYLEIMIVKGVLDQDKTE